MIKNSVLSQNSRYVAGGATEVNVNALEWWERTKFSFDQTDIIYSVEKHREGRLDLIAHDHLGDSKLWWLIAQYNSILDVFTEISEGRIIRIPAPARAKSMVTGQLGGIESQRIVPVNKFGPVIL
jgi:hypothetical protein